MAPSRSSSCLRLRRIGQIAVVRERNGPSPAIDQNRLRIPCSALARRRIAHMPESRISAEALQTRTHQNIRHIPHALFKIKLFAVGTDNSRRFLSAVLESIESRGRPCEQLPDG